MVRGCGRWARRGSGAADLGRPRRALIHGPPANGTSARQEGKRP